MIAVAHIAGKAAMPINRNRIPSCTYTEPGIGSVGLTEAQARAQGHKVKVGKFPFAGNSQATILGSHDGFVKVVADEKYGEILGVHIIGPEAFELIAEAVAAMEAEATVETMMHTIHAHPTLYEAVGEGVQRRLRSGHQCLSASGRNAGRMEYGAALRVAAAAGRPSARPAAIPDQLLLLEHPHVITLGRNGHWKICWPPKTTLDRAGIAFHPTDRGGDVTYHGPGQIVGYPDPRSARVEARCGRLRARHRAGHDRYAGGFRHRRRAASRS